MKFYDIDSIFTFGKYEGMTIEEVYAVDPAYINYCENNIDEFYVSPSVMRELKSMNRALNDSALMNANFDKMTNDEINDFLSGMEEEDEFAQGKLEEDYDWENSSLADDSPFDEFEDEYDEDEINDGFGDSFDESTDGFEELY